MKTTIHKGRIAGSITAPASKSYAQRAVAAALLAGGETTLTGRCTAAMFWDYPTRFAASTHGHGRIASRFDRYEPCKNQDDIVRQSGYDPLADTLNPPGSVFCSHGAGFYVAWDHVREWAHCEVE